MPKFDTLFEQSSHKLIVFNKLNGASLVYHFSFSTLVACATYVILAQLPFFAGKQKLLDYRFCGTQDIVSRQNDLVLRNVLRELSPSLRFFV